MRIQVVLASVLLAGPGLLALAAASPHDAPTRAFLLAPGLKLVGRATAGGGFDLAAVPLDASGASSGIEATRDCLNDVLVSTRPLTANLYAGAFPNVASAGACSRGWSGLQGPVNYLEFYWTGDTGGSVQLWSTDGSGSSYELYCESQNHANVGAGVADTWVFADEWTPSYCTEIRTGLPPSQWRGYVGSIGNSNRAQGSAYAVAATTLAPVG